MWLYTCEFEEHFDVGLRVLPSPSAAFINRQEPKEPLRPVLHNRLGWHPSEIGTDSCILFSYLLQWYRTSLYQRKQVLPECAHYERLPSHILVNILVHLPSIEYHLQMGER